MVEPVPLYESVAQRMQALIEEGTLRAGDRIPSVRHLHRQWSVSITTVLEAYRLLDEYTDMVLRGEDPEAILPQVKHHLEMCMDCQEEFEALIAALRAGHGVALPGADLLLSNAYQTLAADVLDMIGDYVKPGITTNKINDLCHKYITEVQGAIPAPLNYRGFPKSVCTSVNHVVCHGIPGPKVLKDGDILNIDVTVIVDGWFGDSSRMYVAGNMPKKAERLIQVTHDALMKGIEAAKPGNTFGDIGNAIQLYAESNRMSVVRDFCGHGLGRVFHAPPNVLHYGRRGTGAVLGSPGLFTVEPLSNTQVNGLFAAVGAASSENAYATVEVLTGGACQGLTVDRVPFDRSNFLRRQSRPPHDSVPSSKVRLPSRRRVTRARRSSSA